MDAGGERRLFGERRQVHVVICIQKYDDPELRRQRPSYKGRPMADADPVARDGPAGAGRPRRWHHTSLAVTDIDLAIAFYKAVLGLEIIFQERGMAGQIASITGVPDLVCDLVQMRYQGADQVLEFIAFRPAGSTGLDPDAVPLRPGCAHVAFYVDNLEKSLALVEAHGAVRLGEITEFSDGRSVYCRAPGGSFFEMEEPVGDGP